MSTPSKDSRFRADEGFVFRTPLLPMTAFVDWAAAGDIEAARRYLANLVEQRDVREALYVASPSLYAAIDGWLQAPGAPSGQRVEISLVKYVARMMGRSTPFGLFSAVSVGKLGRETRWTLAPRSEYRRRTRLDNDYLFVLIAELARREDVRGKLTYRPNSSLYRCAGRRRYAEARLVGEDRSYHLVSLEPTPYLDATLERAAHGARREELAIALVSDDITLDEARAYIDELIAAQVIVPNTGIFITGPEPLDGLLPQLSAVELHDEHAVLASVRSQLAALDARGVGNAPDEYRSIATALERLPAKVQAARLFQVDMVKPASATLSTRVVADVANAVQRLAEIGRARSSFDDFKRAFLERWEGRTVPLLDVLDEESGIGFESANGPGSEGSPLLAGLPFAGRPADDLVPWRAFERRMLSLLTTALAAGDTEIVLDDRDLAAIKTPTPRRLPDAMYVMCRLAASAEQLARGEHTILVEGAGGPSGGQLLGRFCHASPEIEAIVRSHHEKEEALRPNAVFAEIVHLNEGRIGNILCRPVLREHEIVYLGVSGAAHDKQIYLEDLEVAVRDDRVVLTSRRLGKEVIPRLTTAHNFRLRSLGPYRFLCALASQDSDGVGWSWGALDTAPLLPRVRIGNAIVSRAAWNVTAEELAPITAAVRAMEKAATKNVHAPDHAARQSAVAAAVAALRETRRLPRMFMLSSGDNELPIDLENPLLVAAFADEVAGAERVRLTEMFPTPDRLFATGPEGAFADELILLFTRQRDASAAKTEPSPHAGPKINSPAIRRAFPPGSEWLYAKIYCGESTGDRVLCDAIGPVAREALASGDARQWFFIRYHDPEPHVRVRLLGDPARLCANVLPMFERRMAPLMSTGAVHKVMVDTYVREIERYAEHGIELVEQLFWRDSEAVLAIVELLEGEAGAIARWKLCVRGIDSLLDAVGMSLEQRAKIYTSAKEMLGRELSANTPMWARIGDKFASERAELEHLFDRDPVRDEAHELGPGLEILRNRDAAIAPIAAELRRRDAAGELQPSLRDMAWSLVHMHANRMLHASQRAQELVLYDFLRRLHAARAARSKQR